MDREELNNIIEEELYSEIESLIIRWSNGGLETAGTLTRQIIDLLKSKI